VPTAATRGRFQALPSEFQGVKIAHAFGRAATILSPNRRPGLRRLVSAVSHLAADLSVVGPVGQPLMLNLEGSSR